MYTVLYSNGTCLLIPQILDGYPQRPRFRTRNLRQSCRLWFGSTYYGQPPSCYEEPSMPDHISRRELATLSIQICFTDTVWVILKPLAYKSLGSFLREKGRFETFSFGLLPLSFNPQQCSPSIVSSRRYLSLSQRLVCFPCASYYLYIYLLPFFCTDSRCDHCRASWV